MLCVCIKEVENDSLVKVGTMIQDAEENRLCKQNGSGEENGCQTMIINDFDKVTVNFDM